MNILTLLLKHGTNFRSVDMEKLFEISQVVLNGHLLSFKVNGIPVTYDLAKVSVVLAKASAEEVANMVVDPVGIGFHWPALDEDLSVNGILKDSGIALYPSKGEIEQQAELV
jgi:hypothetical protein